jgi:mycofactocin system glycosyltransferase
VTAGAPHPQRPPTPSDDHLAGLRLEVDRSVRVLDGGRVLLGGSPLRVVWLSDAGARVVRRLMGGEVVPAGRGATALVRRLLDGGLVHPRWGSGPWGPGDVTVVVPVLGRAPEDLLTALLVAGPSGVAPGRVLVVDDASPAPLVLPDAVRADLLRRLTNGGPAAARNTGLGDVATPLVAFVDADCRPEPGWLERVLPHFADPLVAAVAPRIVAVEAGDQAEGGVVARYEAVRSALDLGPEKARVRARTRVSFVPSAALVARTDAVRALGGFDEAMPVGEDVDLVWRLDEHGWVVRYEPAARVGHHHRTDPAAWLRRRVDYGTSAGPLARRHPGALVPVEASAWSVAAWGLAAAGHPVLGAGVAAGTTGLLARRLSGLEHPVPVAARLAGLGHLGAGRLLASAVVRPWWPLTVLAARHRRLRTVAVAAAVVPPLLEWRRLRPPLDPVRWTALRLADDVAYSAGVWLGAWRSRTLEPLRPDLTSWPRPGTYTRWRTSRGAEHARDAGDAGDAGGDAG